MLRIENMKFFDIGKLREFTTIPHKKQYHNNVNIKHKITQDLIKQPTQNKTLIH